jgi:hypothetical protein
MISLRQKCFTKSNSLAYQANKVNPQSLLLGRMFLVKHSSLLRQRTKTSFMKKFVENVLNAAPIQYVSSVSFHLLSCIKGVFRCSFGLLVWHSRDFLRSSFGQGCVIIRVIRAFKLEFVATVPLPVLGEII